MANNIAGNMIFVDTASESIAIENIRVMSIVVTCTHGTNDAVVMLANNDDNGNYYDMLPLKVANADLTKIYNFSSRPIVFPNGIRIKTLTDAEMTIVYERAAGAQ